MTAGVVGVQHRGVPVGERSVRLRLRRAGEGAELGEVRDGGGACPPLHRLAQGGIVGQEVPADERRDLVGDLVRAHAAETRPRRRMARRPADVGPVTPTCTTPPRLASEAMSARTRVQAVLARVPWGVPLARLIRETVRVCLRYRVTGLAAEGGFFMLLSLPPLVLGLFDGLGFVGGWIGSQTTQSVVSAIEVYASRFLSESIIHQLLLPTIKDVLNDGRVDILSVGFLLALWSGSRALNVFVDTISIMHGQSGARGIVHMRAFSLLLYTLGILSAIVVLPLLLLGPGLMASWLPEGAAAVTRALYWPGLTLFGVALLATMYHVSTPERSPWRRDVPGAVVAMVIWTGASVVVRISLEASMGGSSIYGPLSTPIVLLVWLYALAIAILIGAGLNAAVRTLWPVELHEGADVRLVNWAREGAGGLLGRTGEHHATDVDDAADRQTGGDGGPTQEPSRRGREQQFERRSRHRGPEVQESPESSGAVGSGLRDGSGEGSGEGSGDGPHGGSRTDADASGQARRRT